MISRQKLVELNDMMLNLGAPVEKDEVGYNIPDYNRMFNIAFIPADRLTDLQMYVCLDTLYKYTNTQLRAYAQEIVKSRDELQRTLPRTDVFLRYLSENDVSFLKNANAEYIPNEYRKTHSNVIEVSSYTKDGVYLDFEDHPTAHKFKNATKGCNYKYATSAISGADKWLLFVPWGNLDDFLNTMSTAKKKGVDGYVPSEELTRLKDTLSSVIATLEKEALEAQRQAEERREAERIEKTHIKYYGSQDLDGKEGLLFNHAYSSVLNAYKNSTKGMRVISDYDEDKGFAVWKTFVPLEHFKEWLELAKEEGLWLSDEDLESIEPLLDHIVTEEELERQREKENLSEYSPIDVDTLDLPFKPYDFQRDDISAITKHKRVLMGHDMGCGKTMMAVVVGLSIPKKKLVIVPESLRLNWRKEIKMAKKDATVGVLYSKDTPDFSNEWTIVGYSTAVKFEREILRQGFDCVFVDEAHNCKAIDNKGNPASQRARAVMEIVSKANYRYLLTGTPIPTSNKDLFNILKMLNAKVEDRKGDTIDYNDTWAFYKYAVTYCGAYNNGFGLDCSGNTRIEELSETLKKVMVRRTKAEVLPNLTKQRFFIPLEHNSKAYKRVEDRLYDMQDNDTYMGLAMTGRRILSGEKVKSAIDYANSLLAEGRSVVIVSEFDETLDKLKETFKDNYCEIRGGMSDKAKQDTIDRFQNGDVKVCALNMKAGGVGITLTKAHDMIICDYDWTPANMSQVEDRICRSGQTDACNIHYLYCENAVLDEIFVDMITDKSASIDAVVDGGSNTMDMRKTKDSSSSDSYLERLKKKVESEKESKDQTVEYDAER